VQNAIGPTTVSAAARCLAAAAAYVAVNMSLSSAQAEEQTLDEPDQPVQQHQAPFACA
jgi:hypothetical protein